MSDNTDRSEQMGEAEREASDSCPHCGGRGLIETGDFEIGSAGMPGYTSLPCDSCRGTGEIFADDHEAFKSQHGIDVMVDGKRRVVFFDYEGDGIFVWSFPNDTVTDGQHCTEVERQEVYEQLHAWYRDWSSYSPEDEQ